jgi:hypothetical protein
MFVWCRLWGAVVLVSILVSAAPARAADTVEPADAGVPAAPSGMTEEPETDGGGTPERQDEPASAAQFGGGAAAKRATEPAQIPGVDDTDKTTAGTESFTTANEAQRTETPGLYFARQKAGSSPFLLILRPELGVQTGNELCELSASTTAGADVNVGVTSQLRYPVSTAIAGGTLIVGAGRFSFAATALTNLVDPWGTLVDQDFVTASNSVDSETVEFSHTDSRTTLRALALEGALRLRFDFPRTWGQGSLHAVAGFRYESNVYDAYGASGWQLASIDEQVPVATEGEPWVLHYEARYHLPFVGAGLGLGEGKPLAFSAEARLLAGWSTHEDHHVLRHKTGHANAGDVGFSISAEPAYTIAGNDSFRMLLGLSAELQIVGSVDGTLTQEYYADDPSIDGDQLGEPIPDAHFSLMSVRARLLAFFAVRF